MMMSSQYGSKQNAGNQLNKILDAESEFDAVSHAELGQSIFDRRSTMQPAQSDLMMQEKGCHEIAVGSDEAMNDDELAQSLVNRAEAGCNT